MGETTPPRGPRFSCPACGSRNPLKGTGPASKMTVHSIETFPALDKKGPITHPVLCEPGARVKIGFWPWQKCRLGDSTKVPLFPPLEVEPQHLHQNCRVCGKSWVCKTVVPLNGA